MAIGRSRYAPPVSTKGHSVLKTRSYGLSSRAPPTSYVTPRSSAHSTRGEEYLLADRVSNVNYLSNALLDEGYDTALRSRGRDQALLKEATNAIVSSESYATPQTSVASRRVARGDSVGTRAASVPPRPPPKQEVDRSSAAAPPPISRRPVVVLPSPQGASRATSVPPVVVFRDDPSRAKALPTMTREERRSKLRGYSVPPARPAVAPSPYRAALKPIPEVREPALLPPTTGLRAHRVPRRFLTRPGLSRYGYEHKSGDIGRLPYTLPSPKPVPMRESLRDFPKVYVPSQGQRPSNRSKAAIIASKLEPDPIKRRRPRSEYAASKYREMRREKLESPTGGSAVSGGSERRRR